MKKLLILPMIICLLLAGCHPDGDVDMPEPQKPVSEMILGDWNHVSNTISMRDSVGNVLFENTSYQDNDVYAISKTDVIIYHNPDHHDNYGGAYTLINSEGKHYIEFNDVINGYAKYEITAITNTKMIWVMNDSLAALSDQYAEEAADIYPNRLYIRKEFTRQ